MHVDYQNKGEKEKILGSNEDDLFFNKVLDKMQVKPKASANTHETSGEASGKEGLELGPNSCNLGNKGYKDLSM